MKNIIQMLLYTLTIPALLSPVACKKNSQVIQEYKPAFVAYRKELKQLGEMYKYPPPVEEKKSSLQFEIDDTSDAMNADFIRYERLLDPDVKLREGGADKVELYLSKNLERSLRWTGDKSPMARVILEKSGTDLEEKLKRALGLKYIIVEKEMAHIRAEGSLLLHVYVSNRKTRKIEASFRVQAKVDPRLGTEDYKVVDLNDRNQVGDARVVKTGSHNNYKDALYREARRDFVKKAKALLGLSIKE